MKPHLSRLAQSESIHALLLYGAPEGRPHEVAREVAAAWLCDNRTSAGACGMCAACGAIGRGSHADLQVYQPVLKSALILIGQIRYDPTWKDCPNVPVHDFCRTPAIRGARKVVFIEQADRMNASSANALLKILEEPPPYVRFVLSTTFVSRILPTVRSRCVAVPLESEEATAEPTPFEVEARRIATAVGAGDRGMALRLAEEFRQAIALVETPPDSSAALAATIGLSELASAIAKAYPELPRRARAVVAAHRRVQGNCQIGLVLDDLFVKLTR